MDYLSLAKQIATDVKAALLSDLKHKQGFSVHAQNEADTKSTHHADNIAFHIITQHLESYPCQIFMEGFQFPKKDNPDFIIYIDPLDGSLNWDRGIGDPCIALAISEHLDNPTFDHLCFAYVEGLHSGDYYYTENEKSYFYSSLLENTQVIQCKGKTQLSTACGYLRLGYSKAEEQLLFSYPIFLQCRDIRAIENSNMELCELARNAADFMIEARKTSDLYNLLAYPILKYAGGHIVNKVSENLCHQIIQPNDIYDFIATTNPLLLEDILTSLNIFKQKKEHKTSLSTFTLL
ncbi:inositol monophosphatase family protein [uncultured Shewanella sp.]|uniref:inositol monophosphatase family protein n=1 Tax=uncultured Shewanella sp. TaxID=173975 RepID=UPI0026347991|nr:inositol monophosphatase family protein [uncultured Shewanella sp.]